MSLGVSTREIDHQDHDHNHGEVDIAAREKQILEDFYVGRQVPDGRSH